MKTYWLDWHGEMESISTEYDAESVEELLEWANDEFAEELRGEVLTETNCCIQLATHVCKYEIHDSHGAPQCGCEVTRFETWWELQEYLDEHPDVVERLEERYATIIEC